MSIEEDLVIVETQERLLEFERFDLDSAWQVGAKIRQLAASRGQVLSVDVSLLGSQAFFCALPGAKPDFEYWIRRKRNLVLRYLRSSYAIGLELAKQGTTLEARSGLATVDYAAHGGCFPIRVKGVGCIGTVTVSGLPQREDHNLAVEGLLHVAGIEDFPRLS